MTIVSILGESAARSLALALVVAAGLRLLRVQHVRIVKRAWTAVLVLALAMPALVALHIPSFSVIALWAAPPQPVLSAPLSVSSPRAVRIDPPVASAILFTQPQVQEFTPPVTLAVPVPAALQGSAAHTHSISLSQAGFTAYLAISALMLSRVFFGLLLSARLWHRAQIFATAETDLPVRLTVELRSPVTLAHGILLPLEAIAWDNDTLRATLAHEGTHVREGDFYLQLAAALHLCFFWISPLAWWLRPQLARLSETICDRAAIESTGDGLNYAQLLLRFATAQQTPAGMVAMAQSAGLRERVERLIADPELASAFRQRRGQALGAALLLGASAIATAATIHILRPETVVLAAPQAPVTPQVELTPAVEPVPSASQVNDAVSPSPAPQPAPAAVSEQSMRAVAPVFAHSDDVAADASDDSITQISDSSGTDGNSQGYVIYGPDGNRHTMHGWDTDTKQLNAGNIKHPGGAILFQRDGKTWVIDNPALVKQAQEAFAPVEELGKQQGELGERQGVLGEQQGKLGKLQGELGAKQGEWAEQHANLAESQLNFEMPDGFYDAVNQLTKASTELAMQRNSLDDTRRAALEKEQKTAEDNLHKVMAEFEAHKVQREASMKEMEKNTKQMLQAYQPLLKQMQELGARQGELGRLQGELGRQQGLLGMQQSKASREADRKMQSLIDQAVRDGSAHPVQ